MNEWTWVQHLALPCQYYGKKIDKDLAFEYFITFAEWSMYTWYSRKTKTKPINAKHKTEQIGKCVAQFMYLSLSFFLSNEDNNTSFAGLQGRWSAPFNIMSGMWLLLREWYSPNTNPNFPPTSTAKQIKKLIPIWSTLENQTSIPSMAPGLKSSYEKGSVPGPSRVLMVEVEWLWFLCAPWALLAAVLEWGVGGHVIIGYKPQQKHKESENAGDRVGLLQGCNWGPQVWPKCPWWRVSPFVWVIAVWNKTKNNHELQQSFAGS